MYVAAVLAFLRHGMTAGQIDSAERQMGGRLRTLVAQEGSAPPGEMVSTFWRIDCRASQDIAEKCQSAPWTKGTKPGDEVIALVLCWSAAASGPVQIPVRYRIEEKLVIRHHPPKLLVLAGPDAEQSPPQGR